MYQKIHFFFFFLSLSEFAQNTSKNFIRKWGAMDTLMSDNAWEQTSKSVVDILRHYNIAYHHKSEAF